MRYSARDLPGLLRTPLGRAQLIGGIIHRAWPALEPAARAHRATLARRTRVVAVVGSFGKTTTARAVAAALGRNPEALPAHNYLSYLAGAVLRIRPGDRHGVLEAGIAAPGDMRRYARLLRPQVVVVTSIGSEHGPSLGDLAATRAEKAEMVRALGPGGLAVLNGDDPNVRWIAGETSARVVTFGLGAGNDIRATEVELDWPHGTRFTLHAGGESHPARIRLIGRHQVPAALAAVAVARAEGVRTTAALAAIAELAPVPGRLQPVELPSGAFLLRDDFKAPLETVDSALDVLDEIPAERKLVVLGDVEEPPEHASGIYPRLGERVAAVADRAVFVHHYWNGPRFAPAAEAAGMPAEAIVDTRHGALEAADAVAADLRPGDVVLVKGGITQRLDRVSLALAGRTVRCELKTCDAKAARCERCPMLERGWNGTPVVI